MKRLTYYTLGFIAVLFSTYASYNSLKEYISYQVDNVYILALLVAIIIAVAVHMFSVSFIDAVSSFSQNKKVNITPDLTVFILLASLAIFLDLKGVSNISIEQYIDPIESEHKSIIDSKLLAINNQEKARDLNAKHTKNSITNWAMYGTYTKSIRELKVLRSELKELRKEKDEQIAHAKQTANTHKNKMCGGVIISILLMLLSNWGLSGYSVRTVSAQHSQQPIITASDNEVKEELKTVNEYKEKSLSQLEIDLIDGLSIRKSSAKHNLKDWEVREVRKELINSGYIK